MHSPPAWVADAVFYQIFPDRFARSGRVPAPGALEAWDAPPTVHGFKGGDLYGIVDGLDHLARLGATAIYLNPIFASASNHRYHTFDYMAVDPLLGGDEALRALLDAAHRRGMRIILDGVFNHASRGFWPFHHVLEAGRHSPFRDWFYFHAEDLDAGRPLRAYPAESLDEPPGLTTDWAAEHRAGEDSITTLGYRAWWDLPALPKLNTDNPTVREYLMTVAEHWMRVGIDGWRLDVPGEITTLGFWEEFRQRVRAINPEAYIVGEIWQERGDLLDGRTFDALMNYPLAAAITGYVTGTHLDAEMVAQHGELQRQVRAEDAASFMARIERGTAAYAPSSARSMLTLIGSHDTPRFLSMAGGDEASLRLAWLVLMTMPGAPCIYYGDEIGMAGEMDPGCRGAFPWDEARWNAGLLATLTDLVRLRHETPALRSAELERLAVDGMACAYRRGSGPGSVVVALNAGETDARLPLPDGLTEIFATVPEAGAPGTIPARSGRVFRAT
ncbi:MAG TPA: glycoside hydrolase family 13 protein [Candidatus Binatia bacterium]|nr:glycoside hydrolase family 13 protein [Candidatus Binatia bacterium]